MDKLLGPRNPDSLAEDIAQLYLAQNAYDQGPRTPQNFPQTRESWDHTPLSPSPRTGRHPITPSSSSQEYQQRFGWGGEAIPENQGSRVPWFGRSRGGRQGQPYRERDRQRADRGGSYDRGRTGGSVRRLYADQLGADDNLGVSDVVRLVQGLPKGQKIPDQVFQALCNFDSRATSMLLKDLSKAGAGQRAVEIFDWMRGLDENSPLHQLCDVYTYTAMIAQCIYQQDVERALELINEMKSRNIERNVHTYTALMNVCIKCQRCPLALETYHKMRQEGCAPNVVTFNTLIDVYGKMGQWENANNVPSVMKAEDHSIVQGVEPVLRTYNTLMICNNMCHQPRETMAVYKQMQDEGFTPNATTYNALISAYGKAGQLDKVMEVFQEMVYRGCERSVITYSSLISACEKVGQWELALELFNEMHHEGCFPNTVTFNSLITACAQGAQWEKASTVFDEMQSQGCTPDVVTYTALISSYEKGGQWRKALTAFRQMRQQRCAPDSIVYNAIIDALWETGVIWAQRQAFSLFNESLAEGHFAQHQWDNHSPPPARAEINLHAMTAGVAILSLYAWLMDLRARLRAPARQSSAGSAEAPSPSAGLPARLAIVTDKGKVAKEQGNLVVKEAVSAIMFLWNAPFKPASDHLYSPSVLEASGGEVEEWIQRPAFEAALFSFFPCTDILPSAASQSAQMTASKLDAISDQPPDFIKESNVEARCIEAFAAVSYFERTHCLALQNMGYNYLQRRSELVTTVLQHSQSFGLREEVAHDAILLMDRIMSTSIQLKGEMLDLVAMAALMITSRQGESPLQSPTDTEIFMISGLQAVMVRQMEWHIQRMLNNDTAVISTLRCLQLYLERLGCHFLDAESVLQLAGNAFALVTESVPEISFLNCRPSVIAAAILYAERRARGVIPFWPSMLAKLTGYQDMSTPELSVAIKAAQRLCSRLAYPIASSSQLAAGPSYPLGSPSQLPLSPAQPVTPASSRSQPHMLSPRS